MRMLMQQVQKNLKTLLIFSLALSSSTVFAWNCDDCRAFIKDYNMHFYAGADAQMRYINYPKEFGGNLFKKEYPQGNFYLGVRFCDYWGIEGGYETTATRTSSPRIGANEPFLGIIARDPVTGEPTSTVHLTKSSMDGWHAGIMGFLPTCDILCNPVEILGYVGMTRLKVYYHDVPVLMGDDPQNIFTANRTFESTKTILRLGLGLQYTYCTSGFRLMVGYENTGQFKHLERKEGVSPQGGTPILKLKDSTFISAGVFVTFP